MKLTSKELKKMIKEEMETMKNEEQVVTEMEDPMQRLAALAAQIKALYGEFSELMDNAFSAEREPLSPYSASGKSDQEIADEEAYHASQPPPMKESKK